MHRLALRNLVEKMVVRRLFAGLCFVLVLFGARDVLAFPIISTNPVSVFASTGQTVTFTVAVSQLSNSPPLYVQWRRNGANVPGALTTFSNVPGPVFSTLTISNVQAADAGIYFATAFDADYAVNTTNVSLAITNISVLPVGNLFTNRGSITGSSGTGTADNFSSTNEPGTPSNNNIPGGAMTWLKWLVSYYPGGVATVDTRGSDFDTTVGIYQISTNNNSADSVTNLVAIIGGDDEGGYFNSAVSFNVTFGSEYEIGIDGYYGSRGHIVLNWSIQGGGQIPPITQQPVSQTVLSNASAFLSVAVNTNTDFSTVLYLWYFNGAPINPTNSLFTGVTNSSLTIANVLPSTVGQYRVRVQFSDQATNFAVFSQAAQIQINVEGHTHVAAQAKLHQAADPNSYPGGPVPLIAALAAGFTGTQIYNSFQSAEEPGEPNHCGKAGGSPWWFSCSNHNTGTLTVDSYTPAYTNVLAIYTWPGGTDYSSLVSVACASTNAGVGHEKTVFPITKDTIYYMVVDGLSGGYGQVILNVSFVTPPVFVTQPQSQTVPQGSNVTVTALAAGTPTPWYQWRTNALILFGRTNFNPILTNFQAANQGDYDVVATNLAGAVTSSVATLYLDSPMRLTNSGLTTTNSFSFLLLGRANTNYIIQSSTRSPLQSSPPCASTMALEIARPRPALPPGARFVGAKNRRNTRGKFSAAIPCPVSLTVSTARPFCDSSFTRTSPLGLVVLNRVGQQIRDDLREPFGIAGDFQRRQFK
jgi:hypothetical protein